MPWKPPRNKPLGQQRTRKDERGSASARGYDRQHRKMRQYELAEHPLCWYCEQRDKVTAATCIDHIVPLARGGSADDPSNRRPSCEMCNSVKAATTDKGLINTSTEWGPIS